VTYEKEARAYSWRQCRLGIGGFGEIGENSIQAACVPALVSLSERRRASRA